MSKSVPLLACLLVLPAIVFNAMVGDCAVPRIGTASIWTDGPTLLFGRDLQGEMGYTVAGEQPEWSEAELRKSLQRLLDGKPNKLSAPTAGAKWEHVNSSNDSTLYIKLPGEALGVNAFGELNKESARASAVYLKNASGTSQPYLVNMPEVWGVAPARCRAGDILTGWGVNLSRYYGLADAAGKAVAVVTAARGYGHSMRHELHFFNIIKLPSGLKPGLYRLYNWGGLGDAGWGTETSEIEIVAAAGIPAVYNVRDYGARGDGVSDDAPAIQAAIDKAVSDKRERAVVHLPAGIYPLGSMIHVRPGVTLAGDGREATVIEAGRWLPFSTPSQVTAIQASFFGPDRANMLLTLDGRAGLRDVWLRIPTDRQRKDEDAWTGMAAAVLLAALDADRLEDVVIENCRITHTEGLLWRGERIAYGIMTLKDPISHFRFSGNELFVNGPGLFFRANAGNQTCGVIADNLFRQPDPHVADLALGMGGEKNFLLGNRFENVGRGKTGSGSAPGIRPVWRNFWLHNVFNNLRKSDGEMLSYEGGSAVFMGVVTAAGPQYLKAAPGKPWTKDEWRDCRVMIAAGPGMAQIRWITGNDADTLQLDRSWLALPDTRSTLLIEKRMTFENLHVGNDYTHSDQWGGLRSGVRNVWVNEIMDDVCGGHYAWVVNGPAALNLYLGNKYHDRARLMFINGRYEGGRTVSTNADVATLFGNEARHNTFRRPDYLSVENRPDGGIAHARNKLMNRNMANPYQPRPGEVPGVAIFAHLEHTRAANPEDTRLDSMPPQARWNLLANNLFQECPVGVYIGKGVTDTILADNTWSDCKTALKDAGAGTRNVGNVEAHSLQ